MAEAKPRGRRKPASTDVAVAPSAELATVEELIEEGAKALSQITALEDGAREDYVRLAHTLINLRRHFQSPGREFPDWRGRSQQYREAAARIYSAASIPPDSEGSIQARIRYVIGDELRKMAPAAQLDALNYKKGTNADRAKDRRQAKKGKQPLDTEGPTLTAPGAMPITTRAQAFRAIREVLLGPIWDLPIPTDGDEYVECMHELVDAALVLEQLWAIHEQRRSIRRNTLQLGATYAATATKHPDTKEELAAIREQAAMEARVLSAPRQEVLADLSA